MTASVAGPAWTMIRARRGRSSEATKSSMVSEGTKEPSSPWSAMRARVFSGLRL